VALLENLRVAAQPLDLLAQASAFRLGRPRIADQISQRGEELARLARVFGDEPATAIQRVEQEVRLEV